MLIFGKDKKKVKEEVKIEKKVCASDIYLRNLNEYIEFYASLVDKQNPLDDMSFYNMYAVPYYNAATQIADYLKEKYPDTVFSSEDVITLDVDDMIQAMNDETKEFFLKPKYPNLIYIDNTRYFTHFHVQDGVVFETEGIEALPGLSRTLANTKINKLFNGLNVTEVKDLLKQMNILPENTELEGCITMHKKLNQLNEKFLESVVCLLLILSKNNSTIARARLFADSMGIYFDFQPFEVEMNPEKKLQL